MERNGGITILKLLFYILACISITVFSYFFNINIILSMVLSFFVLIICYCIVVIIINSLYNKVLNSDCDPERYLEMMDRLEKRRGKDPKIMALIAINRAAAHISLGNFQRAKEYLLGIDPSYLSKKNGSYLVYTINLVLCHYELGEMDEAELLYETNLVKLSPLGKKLQKSVEILIGERYYFLGKYDLSYEQLNKVRNYDLDKRQYLGVIFRLAQIDIIKGENNKAVKRLNKIVKHGNKLHIVSLSKEMLENINKA